MRIPPLFPLERLRGRVAEFSESARTGHHGSGIWSGE
jgi:hypothetical protein